MALKKTLTNICIQHEIGYVTQTFQYSDAPADHIRIPVHVAEQVRDKFIAACQLAAVPRHTGDGVGVSDFCSMSINPPQEH